MSKYGKRNEPGLGALLGAAGVIAFFILLWYALVVAVIVGAGYLALDWLGAF